MIAEPIDRIKSNCNTFGNNNSEISTFKGIQKITIDGITNYIFK